MARFDLTLFTITLAALTLAAEHFILNFEPAHRTKPKEPCIRFNERFALVRQFLTMGNLAYRSIEPNDTYHFHSWIELQKNLSS